jgi:hypothetical protein
MRCAVAPYRRACPPVSAPRTTYAICPARRWGPPSDETMTYTTPEEQSSVLGSAKIASSTGWCKLLTNEREEPRRCRAHEHALLRCRRPETLTGGTHTARRRGGRGAPRRATPPSPVDKALGTRRIYVDGLMISCRVLRPKTKVSPPHYSLSATPQTQQVQSHSAGSSLLFHSSFS